MRLIQGAYIAPAPEMISSDRSFQIWFQGDLDQCLKGDFLEVNPFKSLESFQLEPYDMIRVLEDVFKTVEWIGSKGYLHADIKPPNINIFHCFDDQGTDRPIGFLGDFDLSKRFFGNNQNPSNYYIWDPCLSKTGISTSFTDPYALSVMLTEVMMKHVNWEHLEYARDAILNHTLTPKESYQKIVSHPSWDFLSPNGRIKRLKQTINKKIENELAFESQVKFFYEKRRSTSWERLNPLQQKIWVNFHNTVLTGKFILRNFEKHQQNQPEIISHFASDPFLRHKTMENLKSLIDEIKVSFSTKTDAYSDPETESE